MGWYIIKNALTDYPETLGPFSTKKEALANSGSMEPSHRSYQSTYAKGKDRIGTKEVLIAAGFDWAF